MSFLWKVVYLLIPTSNHNCLRLQKYYFKLYIFWFLHQTTTFACDTCVALELYIFWFLHQTTTCSYTYIICTCCISFDSYIKPQLLQVAKLHHNGCISFDSYIKPQPYDKGIISIEVVYLLIPTSNHNRVASLLSIAGLYIFWFLHQTTTLNEFFKMLESCISFDSYIKPQLHMMINSCHIVVYLLIPTSNHNRSTRRTWSSSVVYLLIPTSNHNLR